MRKERRDAILYRAGLLEPSWWALARCRNCHDLLLLTKNKKPMRDSWPSETPFGYGEWLGYGISIPYPGYRI
jgi:hypothetical protein